MLTWMIPLITGLICLVAGYAMRVWINTVHGKAAESQASRTISDARREADSIVKEARLQAKTDILKAREEFDASTKARRDELMAMDSRIVLHEANLDRKVTMLEKKERTLDQQIADIDTRNKALAIRHTALDRLIEEAKERIQRVAGMTQVEARQIMLTRIETEVHNETSGMIRKLQEEARETADREAQKIVTLAVQRYAASHASEMMTCSVALPSDDMKGRIIGRDGRNIRAIEAATGVNLLIDDTPEAVVISGFDSVRREIARLALEKLIMDGRIHPGRIEEVVEKTRSEIDETIREAGEEAAYQIGAQGINPELLRVLGRLKFRSSYSQNVLMHSLEVAQLMGVMAGELGLDVSLAKRIGLFHDIGKAVDHEVEGGHAIIGADILKRHGETQILINAVAAHHEEVAAESLYAVLTAAGDAISASRPGARRETTDIYIKRLEKLEEIAGSFSGIERSYAIQAGREIRVIVMPDKIDDQGAMTLARNISKKIENELQYPGQIRVIVIRETRCVEYAR